MLRSFAPFRICLCAVLFLAAAGCQSWSTDGRDQTDSFDNSAGRPPTPQTLLSMARILALQQRDDQAEFVLLRTLRDYPKYLPAYCDLAELQMRQGRVAEAMQTVNDALVLSPDDPVLINDLGMCWIIKADYPRALEQFRKASALAPKDARYRANVAMAQGMAGKYDEALDSYLQIMPPAEAHYNLAVLCDARKDTARAETEYRIARESDPEHKHKYSDQGR